MFRFYNGLSPLLVNNILKSRTENRYNLIHVYEFSRPMVKRVYHGTESISYLGPKTWEILPLKNVENLEHFKKDIKSVGFSNFTKAQHCVKSVRIRSYSVPHFPAIGLNTVFSPNAEKYSIRMRIIFTQCRISLRNSCVVYLYY